MTSTYFESLEIDTLDIETSRRHWNSFGRLLMPALGVRSETAELGGIPSEWLTPNGAAQTPVLLYLHGGAYVVGSPDTHRQMVSHIARAAGIRAVMPDYRLAPENPFPAAIEDAVAVYRDLLGSGYEPANIVVAGDSAGGGLTMALLLSLRDAGDPLPATACLLSPWLDLAATGETMESHNDIDPWFSAEYVPHVTRHYCDDSELTNPLVSPVYADVAGLPPICIQVGSDEILLSDSTRLADKFEAAGIDVDLEIWDDMWHVFQAFVGVMPESRRAIEKLGSHIKSRFD